MVYSFDLDMTPGGVPQIVRLSRYDKKIPELEFTLWNGASGYTIPTGATVFITGSKPDKTGFEYECTYTGSVVSVEVTEQMTAVAGRVVCELTVATSNGKKGSANFFLDVEPSALSDDTVISETDIPIIQHIPEIVAECEDYAETAHKWATFGNDSETPSSTNNALYWAQKAQEYAVGALHWKGSIAFANIPTSGMVTGDLYNITDDFTTDNRFTEGAGIECPAGTDIVWGANDKWDLPLSATNATQVKYGNTTVAAELNQINTSLSDKQDATDNSLTTTNKTIPGAINELNSNLTVLQLNVTGNAIDLASYVYPTEYTAPYDGYLICATGNNVGDQASANIDGKTFLITRTTVTNQGITQSLYVRKGMKLSVNSISGIGFVNYYPIVS